MVLYTCGGAKRLSSVHPCGRAAKALDQAGHSYQLRTMPGHRLLPWTWPERNSGRARIKAITGSHNLPVLVLDDGIAVAGSGSIVAWAREHPRPPGQPASGA